jgi:integrase
LSRAAYGHGAVYKRGKRWWIRYPDGHSGQRYESAGLDRAKAEKLLERRLVEAEDDRLPAKTKERRKTINDLLDGLVGDLVARQKDSAHGTDLVLEPVRKALGGKRAASLTKADITAYIVAAREKYADETIGRQLRCLKQAYGLQKAVAAPDWPPIPHGIARDRLVEPAEQRALIAALDDECYRDMAEFYFATGWRGGEIRKLEWRHVRDDTIRLVAENTKTDTARDYPLVGAVAEIIKRRAAKRVPACSYVFHWRYRQVNYFTWLKAFKAAAVKAGLGTYDPNRQKGHRYQGPTPHDSRRAFATESVNSGVDPQVVMKLTGHKTPRMLDRYRIISADTLARAIEKREQFVSEQQKPRKVIPLKRRTA